MPEINNIPVAIHWFRRDLRLTDNVALSLALRKHERVIPLFIFDKEILDQLEPDDRRVTFIHDVLLQMDATLKTWGSSLLVKYGAPADVWRSLIAEYHIEAVYTNHDHDPYALLRDGSIGALLADHHIPFTTCKDQVIFEKDDVLKDNGTPYTVYTPYSVKWKSLFKEEYLNEHQIFPFRKHFHQFQATPIPSLAMIGFDGERADIPKMLPDEVIIRNYHNTRDLPAINGTSRLSVHLRFGTISIRSLMRETRHLSEKYFNELIWREFYQMILAQFPHVITNSFRPEYDRIQWRNNEREFDAWCQGKTGFPIVDAGMRELLATGHMHNRVRMIVASFLTKDLLIDWRWGEAWFAKHLLDFDLASNNGGWQWAAGCGVDAAPYFRIFNPYEQAKKFDPEGKYIRKWVAEIDELTYPQPIVDHAFARKRTLDAYKIALSNQ